MEDEVAIFTTFTGGWVGGRVVWRIENRANLSQVRLKLRLSLAKNKLLEFDTEELIFVKAYICRITCEEKPMTFG